jgi:hypothetical protein
MKLRAKKKQLKRIIALAIRKGILTPQVMNNCYYEDYYKPYGELIHSVYNSYAGEADECDAIELYVQNKLLSEEEPDFFKNEDGWYEWWGNRKPLSEKVMIKQMSLMPSVYHKKISHYLNYNWNN